MINVIRDNHTYAKTQYNLAASAAWIAKKLYEDLRAHPTIPVKAMTSINFSEKTWCG